MSPPTATTGRASGGLALQCTRGGVITKILQDDLAAGFRHGRQLVEVLAPGHREQAETFLEEVFAGRLTGSVWLPLVDDDGEIHLLQIVGRVLDTGDRPLRATLAGAPGPEALGRLLDQLAAQHPELAAELRRAAFDTADDDGETQHEMFEALAAANNELMTMHRELARRQIRLERINRRQDEILATVAHELRNPLSSVVGFSEFLQYKLEVGSRVEEEDRLLLGRIEAQTRRMIRLVEDLLDASLIGRGILDLDITEVVMGDLLDEVAATHAEAAARKGIELDVVRPGQRLVARVDRRRIGQILDNLVSNAIKYTEKDTGATITLSCVPDRRGVRIRVADQGIGMERPLLARLFEPFTRGGAAGTAGEPSAGLGLAIAHSLAQAHGGEIAVVSEVGRGSTFDVRIPDPDRAAS